MLASQLVRKFDGAEVLAMGGGGGGLLLTPALTREENGVDDVIGVATGENSPIDGQGEDVPLIPKVPFSDVSRNSMSKRDSDSPFRTALGESTLPSSKSSKPGRLEAEELMSGEENEERVCSSGLVKDSVGKDQERASGDGLRIHEKDKGSAKKHENPEQSTTSLCVTPARKSSSSSKGSPLKKKSPEKVAWIAEMSTEQFLSLSGGNVLQRAARIEHNETPDPLKSSLLSLDDEEEARVPAVEEHEGNLVGLAGGDGGINGSTRNGTALSHCSPGLDLTDSLRLAETVQAQVHDVLTKYREESSSNDAAAVVTPPSMDDDAPDDERNIMSMQC